MEGPARPAIPRLPPPLRPLLAAAPLAGLALGLAAAVAAGLAPAWGPALAGGIALGLAAPAALAALALARRRQEPPAGVPPGVPMGVPMDLPAGAAVLDPLTGLPTRAALREWLEGALAQARRQGRQVAVLVLELRNLREVNQTQGRAAADQALRHVALRLRASLRRDDMVARLGGDRFAVVQATLQDPAQALDLAERLAAAIAGPAPLHGAPGGLAADIGIAIGPTGGPEDAAPADDPEDGGDAARLLARAEDALAAARAAPGPTIRCHAPGRDAGPDTAPDATPTTAPTIAPTIAPSGRRALERDLREAIADGAFLLHWQPQRRLADRGLIGFEALLRWPHPTRGLIPPDEFIPLAEASGLIVPLGAWVIRTAAAEAAAWPQPLRVAVNLSAAQLRAPGLLATVTEALAATGLDPRRLELELTESLLMEEVQQAAGVLAGLRALGVSVALDDFGTGWSSLAYLRRFAFDQIKMDRGFLAGLDADPRVASIVAAILGLGRSLGLGVVAEGIETEEQARRLTALGCEEGQGWLLGRPMPAEQARALIAAEAPAPARSAA